MLLAQEAACNRLLSSMRSWMTVLGWLQRPAASVVQWTIEDVNRALTELLHACDRYQLPFHACKAAYPRRCCLHRSQNQIKQAWLCLGSKWMSHVRRVSLRQAASAAAAHKCPRWHPSNCGQRHQPHAAFCHGRTAPFCWCPASLGCCCCCPGLSGPFDLLLCCLMPPCRSQTA